MLNSATYGLSNENGKRQLFLSGCNKSGFSTYYLWEMGGMKQDCGTMTCDYDNDHFNQRLKLQHSHESGHSYCQWSWSKSPVSRSLEVKTDCILLLNS